ncbi:MAG: hypothetical protein R3F62_28175 [Planctomycetota bacterium]
MKRLGFGSAVVWLALCAGCAAYPTALWRAGVRLRGAGEPVDAPRAADEVALFFKPAFGALERTHQDRAFLCGTTRVLRKAALLEPADDGALGEPERRYVILGDVTTEEFPRDEAASQLQGEDVFTVLGFGTGAYDLFEVALDPAFRPDALARLREYAARLGADAVIDVHQTGAAEHHMWHGSMVSLDQHSTRSPVYASMQLMDFRLRDVRLHGTAVRYE